MPIEKLMEKKDPETAGLHQEGSSLLLPKDKRPIGRQGKETNNLITCLENQERMTKQKDR